MEKMTKREWERQVTACEHGRQRRKCEICERDEEIAALKRQLEEK